MDMTNTRIAHRIIDLHINTSIKMTRFLPRELFGHNLTALGRNIVFIVQVSVTVHFDSILFLKRKKGFSLWILDRVGWK